MNLAFTLSPKIFRRVQYILVTVLIILGLGRYLYPHIPNHALILSTLVLFDVGVESSIPTYFSVINLLLAAVLLWVVAQSERASGARLARGWYFLAAVLFYLSLDEGAAIHEHFSKLAERLGGRGLSLLPNSWAWIPFGVALAVLVGFAFLPFLRALPRALVVRFVAAGVIYLTGAVVMEYIGGVILNGGLSGEGDLPYQMEQLVEEALEMYAIAFFNCVVYSELARRRINLTIRAEA